MFNKGKLKRKSSNSLGSGNSSNFSNDFKTPSQYETNKKIDISVGNADSEFDTGKSVFNVQFARLIVQLAI